LLSALTILTAPPARAAATCVDDACGSPVTLAIVWSGQDRGLPWRQHDPLAATLTGSFAPGTDFTWAAQRSSIIGAGADVNLVADEEGVATVTACATDAGQQTRCANAIVTIASPAPHLEITGVTAVWSGFGGRWLAVAGRATSSFDPANYRVTVYKHTDVYYRATPPLVIASNRTWSTAIWVATNVDMIDALLVRADVDVNTAVGCNASWCLGARDPVTRVRSPIVVDGVRIAASARNIVMAPGASVDLAYLRAQRITVTSGALVRSSLDSSTLYLYDQALAATAFALHGQQTDAAQILNALVALQRFDGSWNFSYQRSGPSVIATTPDARYTGAIAWVVLAMNNYDRRFATTTYRASATSAFAYLATQIVPADVGLAIRFNPEDLPWTRWDERTVTAAEHAFETLAAFEGAAVLGAPRQTQLIDGLTQYLAARWHGDHFSAGWSQTSGENTSELYLDTQIYGVLVFGAAGPYAPGLSYNCRTFGADNGFVPDGDAAIAGFTDFHWADVSTGPSYIWTEGSIAMASALAVSGSIADCPPTTADVIDRLASMLIDPARRGFVASTAGNGNGFGQQSSAAAAAWLAITRSGHNPLRPGE
jgi:hypothetical protein